MSELDKKISEQLAGMKPDQAASDMNAVIGNVMQHQRRTKRKLWIIVLAWHVFFTAALLIGAWMFYKGDNANDIAAGEFVCTAALCGLVMIKVIYYSSVGRLRLELQLKQLELAVADVREAVRELKR